MKNLFASNKFFRTVSLNSHYLVVFENSRDKGQIVALSRQVEPGNSQAVMEAFQLATENNPHSYMLIDCSPGTSKSIKYHTDIFSSEPTVFVIKST